MLSVKTNSPIPDIIIQPQTCTALHHSWCILQIKTIDIEVVNSLSVGILSLMEDKAVDKLITLGNKKQYWGPLVVVLCVLG